MHAAPAAPLFYELRQPDGSPFLVRNRGDEWSNRVETATGFTVARDRGGIWRYVEAYAGDEPVLATVPAGRPAPTGLRQHLRQETLARLAAPMESPEEIDFASPFGAFEGPILFILARFTDTAGSTTEADWDGFVSSSIIDFYHQTSHGRAVLVPAAESFGIPDNGIVGWVALNQPHPNTGSSTGTANQQLTKDAILAADPYVDFAAYDANADGYVDASELAVVVVAAGYERSYSSVYTPSVWGHKWSIFSVSPPVVDGKVVGDYHGGSGGYAQFGELHRSGGSDQHQATMGIMVHELGHLIFGLPDLYDTDGSSSGVGNFCLMSGGSWGQAWDDAWPGQTPVLASAWVRWNRGWIDDVVGSGTVSLTAAGAPGATSANTVVQAPTSLGTELFLLENRQPLGYDLGLQRLIGSSFGGLAIWHVDTTQTGNTNDARRLSDLEEGDGTQMGTTRGATTDLRHAGNGATFNDSTAPNSKLNGGSASGVSIGSISASGTVMTATFVPVPKADFAVTSLSISPTTPTANGTFSATVIVRNQGAASGSVGRLDLWTDQAGAPGCGAVGQQYKSIGTLAAGASASYSFTGLPAGAVGSKTLRAFVDSACQNGEQDEDNNQATLAYTVPVTGPDLTVTSVTVSPASPVANSTFSATVQVKNLGNAAGTGGRLDVWADLPDAPACGATGSAYATVPSLAAGATGTYTVTGIPAGSVTGSRTLRTVIDSACQTTETNEGNNGASLSYTVLAAEADLVVTSLTLSPASPLANGTFTATVKLKNQGTVSTGTTTRVDLWTGETGTLTCGAVGNQYKSVGALGPGSAGTYTFSGVPAGGAGAKTLRAFADSPCKVGEAREDNNEASRSYTVVPANPDLVITSVTLSPASPLASNAFTATVKVQNQGNASATGGRLDLWTDRASAPGCGDKGTQYKTVGTLAAGAAGTYTFSGLIVTTAGDKTLRTAIDSACQSAEGNEDNNQAALAYVVQPADPDFVVTSITTNPAVPVAGSTFSASVKVRNQGNAPATLGRVELWTDQAAAPGCGATGNYYKSVATLAAGASGTYTFTGVASGTTGTKTLRAFADSACQAAEPDETNNQATLTYTVQPALPDFVVTAMSMTPVAPVASGTFNVTLTVKNQGTGVGSVGRLDLWPDQGTSPGCGATGTQSRTIGNLGVGAKLTYTFYGLPAGTGGAKTLRAVIDSACAAEELDEANNETTLAYTAINPGPDFVVTAISMSPTAPLANNLFSATVTVKTQGTASGSAGRLSLYADASATPACGAPETAAKTIGTIGAGYQVSTTLSGIPAGAKGTKTLRAFIDSACGTTEGNDDNNQRTLSYTVK